MSQYQKQILNYNYFDIEAAAKESEIKINQLPFCIRVILENLVRNNDGKNTIKKDLDSIAKKYNSGDLSENEIFFFPARVLMQDFTGVPAIVDLATMRDAVINCNGDAKTVNPKIPVDLVIDHSVQVDQYGTSNSFKLNTEIEYKRNKERYEFLKWGQQSLNNFRVVPPGTGICHQVNLEYLAQVVFVNDHTVYPDTLVGTDSHTTMVNALGVLGWGVGGIEAEAAMLGEPLSMLLPEVVGVELKGNLSEGITATDLVLTVTQTLRKLGVVGKFVEFFGDGLKNLSLADRATVSNMSPEYGATCGFFPVDSEVIKYLKLSGRDVSRIELCEKYSKIQHLWYDDSVQPDQIKYDQKVTINLDEIGISLAGPKRPQDKVLLKDIIKK